MPSRRRCARLKEPPSGICASFTTSRRRARCGRSTSAANNGARSISPPTSRPRARSPLDGVGDVAEMVAGLRLLDPEHQAFVSHIDQPARLNADIADQVHPARIAVPAVDDRGYVDIDDVAVLELTVAGNAVAHDVIDRD